MPDLAVNVPDHAVSTCRNLEHASDLKINLPDFRSGAGCACLTPAGDTSRAALTPIYEAERNVLQVRTEWVFTEK
jgi:hypothetical protein